MHDTRFNRRSNYDTEQVRAIARTKLDIGGEWTPVGAATYDGVQGESHKSSHSGRVNEVRRLVTARRGADVGQGIQK